MASIYHIEAFSILREGVKQLVEADATMQYAGGTGDDTVVMEGMLPDTIDVFVVDLEFYRESAEPLRQCLDLCSFLRRTRPSAELILHSPYKYAMWIHRFVEAGVKGFVSKLSGFDMIRLAIMKVKEGEFYMCPLMASQFSNFSEFEERPSTVLRLRTPNFSPRELDVLEGLIKGESTRSIASRLFISDRTVETHRKNLVVKANVQNTLELVNFVSVRGLRLA
ncbi:MAG: response regulator transcription factor [Chitinophagaceae bacterium]|nr:MAG: response regulator transcription factor [Chitinophagaceae bacterium]